MSQYANLLIYDAFISFSHCLFWGHPPFQSRLHGWQNQVLRIHMELGKIDLNSGLEKYLAYAAFEKLMNNSWDDNIPFQCKSTWKSVQLRRSCEEGLRDVEKVWPEEWSHGWGLLKYYRGQRATLGMLELFSSKEIHNVEIGENSIVIRLCFCHCWQNDSYY